MNSDYDLYKKESRLRDSPPAAGRFCDIFHNRRSAKTPTDFSGGSLRTFIPYTILIQHAVFDHIVVTQQLFHYSALHYAEQRLLQCI